MSYESKITDLESQKIILDNKLATLALDDPNRELIVSSISKINTHISSLNDQISRCQFVENRRTNQTDNHQSLKDELGEEIYNIVCCHHLNADL